MIAFGCQKSVLDKQPLDAISGSTYWNTEQDLQLYNNAVYPLYITGFGTGFADAIYQPWGVASPQVYGDVITDNAAPLSYSKVAANEYNTYLSGGSGSGGWNFNNLRTLNFFLDHYQHANISDSIKHVYAGEIYFFKAWDYFEKVKLFGDVPWLTHALEKDGGGSSHQHHHGEVTDETDFVHRLPLQSCASRQHKRVPGEIRIDPAEVRREPHDAVVFALEKKLDGKAGPTYSSRLPAAGP